MKRSFKLLIAFLLIATMISGVVISALDIVFSNDEREYAPKIYNINNNTADTNGPVWYYQYSKDNTDIQWENLNGPSNNYWYTGSSANYDSRIKNGTMFIDNTKYYAHTGLSPVMAYAFCAPEDRTVKLAASIPTLQSGFTQGERRPMVRITINDVNIYPEENGAWINVSESPDFTDITFDVKAGDMVRFEMTSDAPIEENDKICINWAPQFTFYGTRYYYTEDIYNRLTVYMDKVFRQLGEDNAQLDTTSQDDRELASALKNATQSKFGTYSVTDTVYDTNKILESNNTSVWKFGIKTKGTEYFCQPADNFILSAEISEQNIALSWENTKTASVYFIKAVDSNGDITKYSTWNTALTLPLSEISGSSIQISDGTYYSNIISVGGDGGCEPVDFKSEETVYLNSVESLDYNIASANIKLYDGNVNSNYQLYYWGRNPNAATVHTRGLVCNLVSGEEMRLGFTAPYTGEYSVSAPLVEENSKTLEYYVEKEEQNGEYSLVQSVKQYTEECDFCNLQITLNKGETIWLAAKADESISINIGNVKIRNQPIGENGYSYKAIDFTESIKTESLTYATTNCAENATGVWNYGYFPNTVTQTGDITDYDGLKLANYIQGSAAEKLESALKKFEIVRNESGITSIFHSLPSAMNPSDAIGSAGFAGRVGTLYVGIASKGGNNDLPFGSQNQIYAKIGVDTNKNTGEPINIGVYLQYSAPLDGNAVLTWESKPKSVGDRLIILKDSQVYGVYNTASKVPDEIDFGYIKKGTKLTLCYAQLSGSVYAAIGSPIMKNSADFKSVIFEDAMNYAENSKVPMGSEIVLPQGVVKDGQRFVAWVNESGEKFASNTIYKISQDVTLSPYYEYYGDLNVDGVIGNEDLVHIRKEILGLEDFYGNADVNADGILNLTDLVRMKKWLAGLPTYLGE